jgi:ATP-binding protein involved in chromosome partitioning
MPCEIRRITGASVRISAFAPRALKGRDPCAPPRAAAFEAATATSATRGYDIDANPDRNPSARHPNPRKPALMMPITEAAVMDALRHVQEPELGGDLVTRNMVRDLVIDGAKVAFQIELTTPACPLKDEIESRVHAALDPIGVESVELTWGASVRRAAPRTAEQLLPGVKNVLAVASGKGGVGKSTVAVNLAVALARDGASVGLLDADITGPNVPLMLGLEGQPEKTEDNKIKPLVRHGVKAISIQFFVPAGQPIIWRGPLVGGAITQFLRDVDWGELDYLVIDLPPGTSDAQLTLAQAVPVSGAVLVTTPQEVSLLDVEKALAMFKRMSVPVLGVVENMTAFICPHCGEATEIFGRGGGERFATQFGLEYLGGIPLDITVRQGGDVGVPAVAQREPGPAALALTSVARTIAARMSVRAAAANSQPVLTIS